MIRRDFQLILKRASVSRPSGEWSDDDFDVLADGVIVGRVIRRRQRRWGSPGCGRSPSAYRAGLSANCGLFHADG
jgi:hypothetical protein